MRLRSKQRTGRQFQAEGELRYQATEQQSNSRDKDKVERPRPGPNSTSLGLVFAPWPRGSECQVPSRHGQSFAVSTPTPGGSLLTLLIPHSVPSRRGTRSRVQLDLSAGCTWHERTLQMSWCGKKIREFRESGSTTQQSQKSDQCTSQFFSDTQQCKFLHFSCHWAKTVGKSDHHCSDHQL